MADVTTVTVKWLCAGTAHDDHHDAARITWQLWDGGRAVVKLWDADGGLQADIGYTSAVRIHRVQDATAYVPVAQLKATREALCAAQSALGQLGQRHADGVNSGQLGRLQALIDQIDAHRPLGVDGKHGNRHTPTCGCEDR